MHFKLFTRNIQSSIIDQTGVKLYIISYGKYMQIEIASKCIDKNNNL